MKYKSTGIMLLVAIAASSAVVYASNNVSAMKFLGGRA